MTLNITLTTICAASQLITTRTRGESGDSTHPANKLTMACRLDGLVGGLSFYPPFLLEIRCIEHFQKLDHPRMTTDRLHFCEPLDVS